MAEKSYTEVQLRTIKKRIRWIRAMILLVLFVAIALVIFFKGYGNAKEKYERIIQELEEENQRLSDPIVQYDVATKEVSVALIRAEIQDIGELATIEYFYTDAGKFESPAELFGKEIPLSLTTRSFIAKWDGRIKAGVDMDKITVEVDNAKKTIIVHMPKAEILSHEIDSESIETLDERNGLFNPIKVEDVRNFDAISKEAMEKKVTEIGLLEKALENAKQILRKIIDTGVVEELEYTIQFQVMEE